MKALPLLLGLFAGIAVSGVFGWQTGFSSGQKVNVAKSMAPPPASPPDSKGQSSESTDANVLGMLKGRWDEKTANVLLNAMSEIQLADLISKILPGDRSPNAADLRGAAYRAWARKHPEAALARALQETDEKERLASARNVFGEWVMADSKAALATALKLDNVNLRNSALQRCIGIWSGIHQMEALDFLAQNPELPNMTQLMYTAFQVGRSTSVRVDYAEQLALAERFTTGYVKELVTRDFIAGWVAQDPAAALAYVMAMPSSELRSMATEKAYGAWANVDLQSALQSAEGLADETIRSRSLQGIYERWLQNDPLAAAEHIAESNSPDLLRHLSGQNYNFMLNLTDQEQSDLVNRLPAGATRQRMIGLMVNKATFEGDYPRAVEIYKMMTNPEVRNTTLFDIAKEWGNVAPIEVEDWLRQIPPSAERDVAVSGYIPGMALRNPTEALTWADTLQDPNRKQTAQMNIAYQWMRRSPAEAQAWMDSVKLSAESRKMVMQAASRRGNTIFDAPLSYRTSY